MAIWEELRAACDLDGAEEKVEVGIEILPQDACRIGVEVADRDVDEVSV